MPSLIEHLTTAFYIAAWFGFSIFFALACLGGWISLKVIGISWRVTYARWRWMKYKREIDENGNLLFSHKLANEFIREANKTMATEPTPPPNPYAPNTTNGQQTTQASGGSRQEGTKRKMQ